MQFPRFKDAFVFANRRVPWAVLIVVVCLRLQSFAALGGDASSVQADQAHFQASLRSTRGQAYSMQELHSPAGTVIREYVSPAGRVFGVAWQGPWLPDMNQLLGNYFEQYRQAVLSSGGGRIGRRPFRIELPGLVVQLSGHSRSFSGQAYVPDMLPQGMGAGDIQ